MISCFLLSTFLFVTGCERKKELSAYVFNLDEQGVANPDEMTSQYVKPIGNLTTGSYSTTLKLPEPKWSRIVIRNRTISNGRTDAVYDLNISDEFRFEVNGGYTSIEKVSGSATYIIDITDSGKRSFNIIPRQATEDEIAQNVIVATGIVATIIAILGYVLFFI